MDRGTSDRLLGIETYIVNAPTYLTDLKGTVERHFRTLNETMVPYSPGRVRKGEGVIRGRDNVLIVELALNDYSGMITEIRYKIIPENEGVKSVHELLDWVTDEEGENNEC